jgi:hypothetical protein
MSQNENTQKTDTQNSSGTYKRIKIENLPRDITREHIEELCSKFGRVNEIEMRRLGQSMRSFVSFFNVVDAEYALYRIFDMTYMGEKLKVYPAEEKEGFPQRKNEGTKVSKKKPEGGRGKTKPKGSLRHLAPRNAPTGNLKSQQGNTNNQNQGNNGNNGSNGNNGNNGNKNNVQVRNQGQGQGPRKNQGNGFGRGNQGKGKFQGNQPQGNQQQRNQQKRNNNQPQEQKGNPRNQGNNEQNRSNQSKGKYRVKNTQQNENYKQDEQTDDAIFEVIVKNTLTGKQILYTRVTQENLNSFPSEVKLKIDYSE